MSCPSGQYGYSCGGGPPNGAPGDNPVECAEVGPDGAGVYCCGGAYLGPSTCIPDASLTGCAAGQFPFGCTGGDDPAQHDASLTCTVATSGDAGAGGQVYCCSTSG